LSFRIGGQHLRDAWFLRRVHAVLRRRALTQAQICASIGQSAVHNPELDSERHDGRRGGN
jgi:hypothetical protein